MFIIVDDLGTLVLIFIFPNLDFDKNYITSIFLQKNSVPKRNIAFR